MARSTLRIVVSLALAAGLMVLFLWNIDFRVMGRTLANAHAGWITVAVATGLFSIWLRAVRWQQILRPVGRTRHSSAVLATAVGYAAIALLPARMGDVLRPVLLSRRDAIPTSATLASILTERLFDLWTVIFFFLIFLLWPPPMAALDASAAEQFGLLRLSGWLVGGGLLAGTAFLFALFALQDRVVGFVTAPLARIRPGWTQPVTAFFGHFLDGLRVIQRPRDLFATLAFSFVIWMVVFLQLRASWIAFDLDLPFRAAFVLVSLTVIGLLVPTPGGLGGFHAMMQLGLTLFFAVEPSRAAALSVGYHAICFVPIAVIGTLCVPLFGLSFKTTGVES